MLKLQASPLRVLDFDIENRPLSYLGHDFTTSEITAIACSFGSYGTCWLLGEVDTPQMLAEFREWFDQADVVTGHYILKHDLPIINGAMLEYGMAPLPSKLVQDTCVHLKPIKGVSKSQEALADMLGVDEPKIYMSQQDWRKANRLQRLDLARRRVVGDVRQHIALRKALLAADLLKPPERWQV
jgi:hypothetical protein